MQNWSSSAYTRSKMCFLTPSPPTHLDAFLAHGLCIVHVPAPYTGNAHPLAVWSLPNSGHGENHRAATVWWYANTHCVLYTSATLEGIFHFQTAAILLHMYKGRIISAVWKTYHFKGAIKGTVTHQRNHCLPFLKTWFCSHSLQWKY